MKLQATIALFVLIIVTAMPAAAQVGVKPAGAKEVDPKTLSAEEKADIARRVGAISGPGKEHKEILAAMEGSWDVTVKAWSTPGGKPMQFRGSSTSKRILGGMFLQQDTTSQMGGMTVSSMSIVGFDRRSQNFTLVAFDSMGTYPVTAAGPYDPKTQTITMYGEDWDPIMRVTQKYNFIMRLKSKDEFVTEIVFLDKSHGNEGPFKMVEVTSNRRKK